MPAPQIRLANRRYCALYKFIYLLTYLLIHITNILQVAEAYVLQCTNSFTRYAQQKDNFR